LATISPVDGSRTTIAPADVGTRTAYLTGSTMKAVTLTAALEEGVVSPTDSFDCEQGAWKYQGQVMHDPAPHGTLTVPEMLAVSTNVGFAKIFDRLGGARLERWLKVFHFGVAPEIEGASGGSTPVHIEDKSFAGAVAAIGDSATATPLQMAAAYAAIANGGFYVAPTLAHRTGSAPREAIMKPETSRTMVTLLEGAVNSEQATGKLARVAGTRVAGKTGTAGWELPDGREGVYASFVGFFPSTAPRFVIVVGVEQPREGGTGPSAAAPGFARVASRILGT
jgi:cell division protein FtsI (penicillin-binding protein 3)